MTLAPFDKSSLYKKAKHLKQDVSNGIYYFLGNIPQHITHVLPLYDLIGGTVVVASQSAVDYLKKYPGITPLLIDDQPEIFLELDTRIEKTIAYLNEHAKAVFVYETFVFDGIKITTPTIMLSHGIPIKDYWVEWKIKTVVENYTYIATLGPFMKEQLIERGVPEDMCIDIGLTRNDLIIRKQAQYKKKEFLSKLPSYKKQPIVSYMPTYWGASSVFDTGLEILENISDKYYVIFKPHPQTSGEIIEKYIELIAKKNHIHFIPEDDADLLSIYKYSDVLIGDMSSVVADAILADIPVIFAYGGEENKQDKDLYKPIREVLTTSFSISQGQGDCTNLVVDAALHNTYSIRMSYPAVRNRLFHNLNGDSREHIAHFIISKIL